MDLRDDGTLRSKRPNASPKPQLPASDFKLPPRWSPLRGHPVQTELANDEVRFKVVAAGRRSGKTELAKRHLIRKAISFAAERPDLLDGFFWATAPTQQQGKKIYWNDLKRLVPYQFVRRFYETDLIIALRTGVEIGVAGLDKPERIEGSPIDGIVIDEYANCKPNAWTHHVRPGLDTDGRKGWAWLIGVPEGRNHFYRLWYEARTRANWKAYHWRSEDILDAETIRDAKKDLDARTYEQEYGASFIDFSGTVYYSFNYEQNVVTEGGLAYDRRAPLIVCFDFNVDPGVAVICQEIRMPSPHGGTCTLVLDEIRIQRSNTPMVVKELIARYGKHLGHVYLYGDATGGAEGTAKLDGSDWTIIRKMLKPVFGDRLHLRVPKANPRERLRVNAVNSRLKPLEGPPRVLIDGNKCPNLILDFEGVTTIPGTSGQIDKKRDETLTHLSDAFGYYVWKQHRSSQSVLDIAV